MVKKEPKKFIESEGRITQEAIQAALVKLGTTRENVIVKVLSEGERGLYGMNGGKPARVRVTLK